MNAHRTYGRRTLVVVIAVALAAIASSPAVGVPDNQPPKLSVALKPAFVVGSIVSVSQPFDVDPENGYTSEIRQAMGWSATDNVGVCSYDLFRVFAGFPPEPVFEFSQQTRFTDSASDYDGTFGGGSFVLEGWRVTARDCAGNATTKVIYMSPTVTQEDNANAGHPTAGTFHFTGTWTTSQCVCHSGGATRRTVDEGARAKFVRTYVKGDHVAVLMAEGPTRGRAAILLDGRQIAVVDTFAQVNTNRVVMFQRRMPPGQHTLVIQNLASSERPRIDVDAILTN